MPYEVIIGLEVHVQVRTASKMFCACANRFGATPNSLVCPVCLGYPGTLPTPNATAIEKTVRAGLLIDCQIPVYSKFDRKSYFYPDMPKNYQISQYDLPLCIAGKVHVAGKSLVGEVGPKDIGVTRIHLEEDVGKLTHFDDHSGVDYNRAGVPLMEIVSEPDMRSADEAYAYLTALKQVMQYADISDCDMEKGQMRCDVNISVRPIGQAHFNTKTELKNLNSFKSAHRAILYETDRQIEMLQNGEPFVQATRGWNDDAGVSYLMRVKESDADYRYFPEPDLMPIEIGADRLAAIRATCPEPPAVRRARFETQYELSPYDADVLTLERANAEYFEATVVAGADPKKAANWIMNDLPRELSAQGTGLTAADAKVQPAQLAALIALVDSKVISSTNARVAFTEMCATGADANAVIEAKGLKQTSDTGAIAGFAQAAIDANPGPVQEFREGKEKALNFLVGQVMKASRGKANPQVAREALLAALGAG